MQTERLSQTWQKSQASFIKGPEPELLVNEAIKNLIFSKREALNRKCWFSLYNYLEEFFSSPEIEKIIPASLVQDNGAIKIGVKDVLSQNELNLLMKILKELIPWRKGPFEIFGEKIEAEWRSDFKWDRISPHLDCLKGMRVLDLGCGNAYYMLRALEKEPEFIWGFDPSEKFFLASQFLLSLIKDKRLTTEMLGAENLNSFPEFFNAVLCMGVIYHQRNPLQLLSNIYESLRYRGLLVLESQVLEGEESVALFPEDRYAKARNVFFLPTVNCLKSWLKRTGFVDIEVVSIDKTDFSEQRKTEFAPYESLEDFLDKKNPSQTIEGHPAPLRAVILARKKSKR